MNEKKTIILILGKETWLRYFGFVARLLLEHTDFQPVFWGRQEEIARLRQMGLSEASAINFSTCTAEPIGTPSPNGASGVPSSGTSWLRKLRTRIRRYYERPDLGLLQKVVINVLVILTSRIKSKRLIRQLNPRAVCVVGDNSGLAPGDFLRLCNKAGVNVVHFPVVLSHQEWTAEVRARHRLWHARGENAHWLAKIITRYFPDQTFEYKNQLLFYHGLDEILAMILTGSLTPKPWILGMSRADKVLFSTEWEKAYWVVRGLSVEKTSVVGFYELDVIRNRRWRLPLEADSADNIVYNVPILAEHNVYSWDKHWEMIEKDLKVLKGTGCNLILVLHPKSSLAEYEWLEGKYNCRIHRKGTAEILPLCSLYISVGSTTDLWAASLGIRVIDLSKIYGLDVPVFHDISRIMLVSSRDDLKDLLDSAFHEGRRLREAKWYVDRDEQASYLAQPSIRDALLSTFHTV